MHTVGISTHSHGKRRARDKKSSDLPGAPTLSSFSAMPARSAWPSGAPLGTSSASWSRASSTSAARRSNCANRARRRRQRGQRWQRKGMGAVGVPSTFDSKTLDLPLAGRQPRSGSEHRVPQLSGAAHLRRFRCEPLLQRREEGPFCRCMHLRSSSCWGGSFSP